MKQDRTPLFLGVLAALAVLAWQTVAVMRLYDGKWTGLFCIGSQRKLPPEADRGAYRWREAQGYDGQFYRLVAHDPALSRGYADYIDDPRLRYRRILLPALAYILGAGRAIDAAYVALMAAFIGAGVYFAAKMIGLWGIGLLVLPGALTSMDRMLVDGALASLAIAFWWYSREERWRELWLVCALAGLTRETGLLLPLAAAAQFALERRWRAAAAFFASALPALAWFAFVHSRTDPSDATAIFALPGIDLLLRLLHPRPDLLLAVTDALSLIGLIAVLLIAVYWAFRGAVSPTLLAGFAALGLVLGSPAHLTEPYGFTRPVAPLIAVVFLEGLRRRQAIAVAAAVLTSAGVALPIAFTTAAWFR